MSRKALVVIDIQNDITKHYRDIIDNINSAIDWAMKQALFNVYGVKKICPAALLQSARFYGNRR